jgi:hypothetical protein
MAHDAGEKVQTGRSSLIPRALQQGDAQLLDNARQLITDTLTAMETEMAQEPTSTAGQADQIHVRSLLPGMPGDYTAIVNEYERLVDPEY